VFDSYQDGHICPRSALAVRLDPARGRQASAWEQLRILGGALLAGPGEPVREDEDLEAMRLRSYRHGATHGVRLAGIPGADGNRRHRRLEARLYNEIGAHLPL
jgi:hypothetical protein